MAFSKLNLSCCIVCLLLLFSARPAHAQRHITQITIKDGKIESFKTSGEEQATQRLMPVSAQRNYTINSVITLNITTIGASCEINNGSLIVSASGGTPPYIYSLSNGATMQTGYFAYILPGTYTLTVTDATNQTVTTSVTISNTYTAPIWIAPTYTPTSACNTADATVTLSGSGGTPPYQYSLDGINYQSSNVFTNLYPGIYNFIVRDANGCQVIYNTVGGMLLLFGPANCTGDGFALSGTLQVCGNNGFMDGEFLGSGGPFQYSLDGVNYQPNWYFNNLPAGIHLVHIKNGAGQVIILAVAMRENCYIQIDYVTVDASCQQNNGELTVTAANGTPPYTYTIDGLNYQSSNVFTGLSPGDYFVTAKDVSGFTHTVPVTVHDRCPDLSLSATGETCAQNDGTITATAIRGTSPYQYSLDGVNFQASNTFTGLVTGSYTVTLKDALGFTDAATITVPNSCLSVFASAINSTCGNNNGSITTLVFNGTAPFQYSLDAVNFQSGNIFNGLTAGTYTVTVKDISGKTGNATATVLNSPGPQISTTTNPAFCANNNGTITITTTGGTSPLQYSTDGTNYQSGSVFNNLGSGSYTVWAKDANGCLASQAVTVAFNCPSIAVNWTDETCSNDNAVVTVTATGGTPPYQYSIGGTNYQSNNVFTGISAGTYTLYIKDALGAINNAGAAINNICPTVTATVTNGICGTSNASILAVGANGAPPYQYSIDGINFQSSNSFSGLADGSYTITVKDASGLTNTTTVVAQNFPGPIISISSTASSCLNNDGTITVSASGGVLPLRFSIDGVNFSASNIFSSVSAANYTAIAKDANGCLDSKPVIVQMNDNLSFIPGNPVTICEGKTGKLNCTSNGTGFTWSPSATLSGVNQLNPTASPVITTMYYVTATLGVCTKTDSAEVIVNPAPLANAGNNITICFGKDAQLNGSGGLDYKWTPATYLSDPDIANPVSVKPPAPISYSLEVTDGNDCKSIQPSTVTVTVTPPAKVFAGNDTSIVMNQPFILHAKDVNNSGFINYTWLPSFGLNSDTVQNPVAILDRDMKFIVSAFTADGCEGEDEISIKVYKGPEIYVPTAFSPNGDGHNDILRPIPVGIKEFKYFMVYNRWGQRIFYASDPNNGWNGRVNGIEQNTNTFVWIAEGIDDKGITVLRRGTVTLIR